MHVQECYFVDGRHYGPPGCYHDQNPEPEELTPGWTVQRRKPSGYQIVSEIGDPGIRDDVS